MKKKTKPVINPEETYLGVEKMLYRLAWRISPNQQSFEDAAAEAKVAYMKACQTYDPQRGTKFSTWCYFKVWRHLQGFSQKRAQDRLVLTEMKEELVGAAPANRKVFLEMIDDLSSDAKELISLLVDSPPEILEEVQTPQQLLKNALEHLGFISGWDNIDGELTMLEISSRFEELEWSQLYGE